jgi:hypothetical protein
LKEESMPEKEIPQETPENIKTIIKAYKLTPEQIPTTEWNQVAKDFVDLVVSETLTFDNSLLRLMEEILKISILSYAKQKGIKDANPDKHAHKNELMVDNFKSLNLGFLYGYSLGRLLHDNGIIEGEIT